MTAEVEEAVIKALEALPAVMAEDEAIPALNTHLCASETESLADTLKHVGFGGSAQHRLIGRVSPTQLALLVPRGIALAELNTASSQLVMQSYVASWLITTSSTIQAALPEAQDDSAGRMTQRRR